MERRMGKLEFKLDQSNSFCGSPNTEEIENSFKVIPVRVRPLGLQV